MSVQVSDLDLKILNCVQNNFPITSEPFNELANQLNIAEEELIRRLQVLKKQGFISRLGAVFNHQKAGASTLMAMQVPESKLLDTAKKISAYSQVNHNYQREHRYNLWFVLTSSDQDKLNQFILQLRQDFAYPLLDLPMLKGFHIDLSFPLIRN